LLLPQPIKKKRTAGAPGDLPGVQRRRPLGTSLRHQSQSLIQSASATEVGPAQRVVSLFTCHQEMDVVVVDAGGVGEKRDLRIFMPHIVARGFEGGKRGAIFIVRRVWVLLVFVKLGQRVLSLPL